MAHHFGTTLLRALIASVALAGFAHTALADGNGRNVPLLPQYKQECDSCHVAYPPTLMPAASWSRILNDLSHHFGTDASVDPASLKTITAWVQTHAGAYKRVREEPPQDRITRTAWFERKHREVPATRWSLPAVKSAANCAACHTQADSGDFSERNIRTPR